MFGFFSREAGQDRRKWLEGVLDENIADPLNYFLGPTGIPGQAAAANEVLNPVEGIGDAMAHGREFGDTGDPTHLIPMLTETVAAAAPIAGARAVPVDDIARAATKAADATIDTLTGTAAGLSQAADEVGDAGIRLLADDTGSLRIPAADVDLPLLKGTVADLPERARMDVLAAVDKHPEIADILPMIHPDEAVGITPGTAQTITQAYNAVDQGALEAAALAGQAKRGWYEQSAEALQHVFGKDTNRFTSLLSALSPQTSVESNLQNALGVWKNWTAAGRPTDPGVIKRIMGQSVQGNKGEDSVLDAWVNNSIRALTEPSDDIARLSGPKVDSFAPNTAGDLSRNTLDVHQSDLTGFDQNMFSQTSSRRDVNVPGYGPGYIGASAAHRGTAKAMSDKFGIPLEGANVQEMGWSYAKPMKDLFSAPGNTSSMMEMYNKGELTDDLVVGTPDFATLLKDPTYGNILQEAGYGPRLDTLTHRPPLARIDAEPDPDALARATNTLQRAVTRNRVISATAPYRAGAGDTGQLGYQRAGRGSVELGTGDVSGIRLEPDPGFVKAAAANKIDVPPMVVANKASTPQVAAQAADYHSQLPDWLRGMVDLPSVKDYRGATTITTNGGTVMVKKTGEIAGLMKGQGGPRGFTQSALHAATQNKGTWLNAYDTMLPQAYSEAGFRPVARIKFNREYAPDGWDYERLEKLYGSGEPDIVFMMYDPKFKGKVTRGMGGKVFDDYDEAAKYTQELAEKKNVSN